MKSFFSIFGDPSVTSVAIGKFDGMHLAHQRLFSYLDEGGAILTVDAQRGNLTPGEYKREFTPFPLYSIPLGKIKHLSGERFIYMLKKAFPNLTKVVVGYDFRFGKNRAFGVEELRGYFAGEVVVVPEVFHRGHSVHSEAIRELIAQGEMNLAGELLGRDYFIEGRVVRGNGLGSSALFATINLEVESFLIPLEGVYATKTKVGERCFGSVSFVGKRLSVDNLFSIETHLLGVSPHAIPKTEVARIYFLERLRENRRFAELSSLKAQISEDIGRAEQIHAKAFMECMNLQGGRDEG